MTTNINPSVTNIYGVNSFINKFNTTREIIDLDEFVQNFKIDYKFDKANNTIIYSSKFPAFTKINYNKRIKITDDFVDTSTYNYPPIGPIEPFCYCFYCQNTSPSYHFEECKEPSTKSLYITIDGLFKYIIYKSDYDGKYNDLKQKINNSTLTQIDLNNILLLPGQIEITDNTLKLTDDNKNIITNILYLDVKKKRGPSKIEYDTSTTKFSNNLFITYEIDEERKTNIRISKNGLINIINLPQTKSEKDVFYTSLIQKIPPESINIEQFNELASEHTSKTYTKYEIINNISYIHSINAQFNLWEIKEEFEIDFQLLSNIISPFNSDGLIIAGQFTRIENLSGKQIIILNDSIKIINWEYSLGKETKVQTITRQEIKCIIIPVDGIKITLTIHKYGTFQMSMSYCNMNDLKQNICSSLTKSILDPKYFEIIKNNFVLVFRSVPSLINKTYKSLGQETKMIKNTVEALPELRTYDFINSKRKSTEVCRLKTSDPKYPNLEQRPYPYSWKGKCPETRQLIELPGVPGQAKDSSNIFYYPCCSMKNKKNETILKDYLIDGFPKDQEEAIKYGITSNYDSTSGILIPGSTNIGATTRAVINDRLVPVKIIGYPDSGANPKRFKINNLLTNETIIINRSQLERDSRFFEGLKTFSKKQLINCILQSLKFTDTSKIIINKTNLQEINSYINLDLFTNNNNFLTVNDLNIFTKDKYYVTSVPVNAEEYFLFINNDIGYYINIYGNKIPVNFSPSFQPSNNIFIFYGFKLNDEFYIINLIYYNQILKIKFNQTIELLLDIDSQNLIEDENIKFSTFKTNIIEGSKELLELNINSKLIFIPENNSVENIKIWYYKILNESIILQILQKIPKTVSSYALGYEDTKIPNLSIFNNIKIDKSFITNYKININNYILFEYDYNRQTKMLSSKILNPIDKVKKPKLDFTQVVSNIYQSIKPITVDFFMSNIISGQYSWFYDNKLYKFINSTLPLELN